MRKLKYYGAGAQTSLRLLVQSMPNWTYDELLTAHAAYSGSGTEWAATIVEAAELEMARRDAGAEELHEVGNDW